MEYAVLIAEVVDESAAEAAMESAAMGA